MGVIKNLIKKYATLLPPVGMLVLAVLLLLPVLWLGGRVKAQVADSAKQAQTIRSLVANVPSRGLPEQMRAYMDQLEKEVGLISDLIRQSSQRELVAWNLFPAPRDSSAQVYNEYGTNYQRAIERRLKEMNALDAPSESEIRQRTGSARTSAGGIGGYGAATTRRTAARDPMVDALCIARAESISVYANPASFRWYDFWRNFKYEGAESALRDCWNSQIALWIYDDIVKSIQAMNVGSEKVSTSPVKRLLGVSFSGPVQVGGDRTSGMYGMATAAAGRDNPNYVTAALPSVFLTQHPWTNRVGGPDYDVVHFAVSVIIDSRHVLGFIRELCSEKEHTFREGFEKDGRIIESRHNQITILQSAVHAVDKDSPVHELYRYGDGAAMQLDLVCEYLLNREGYDQIKPDSIKQVLGQQTGQGEMLQMGGSQGMPGGRMPMMY